MSGEWYTFVHGHGLSSTKPSGMLTQYAPQHCHEWHGSWLNLKTKLCLVTCSVHTCCAKQGHIMTRTQKLY